MKMTRLGGWAGKLCNPMLEGKQRVYVTCWLHLWWRVGLMTYYLGDHFGSRMGTPSSPISATHPPSTCRNFIFWSQHAVIVGM